MGDTATAPHTPHQDTHNLLDPAPVPLFGAYASWSRRVVAFLLDNALLAGLTFLVVGPGPAPSALPFLENVSDFAPVPGALPWKESAWIIGALLVLALLQAYTGATPGKRTVGIVVVNRDSGRPVGFVVTVLRWLFHAVDALCFIGYLRPLWDPQRRTFADSLALTVVVRSVAPEPHPWFPSVPGRRGSRAVTAGATVLCVTGVVFAVAPTTWTGGASVSEPCTAWEHESRPDEVGFSEASISGTMPGTISRLGITRPFPARHEGWAITSTWTGSLPQGADVRLEAVLTSPDGAERLEYMTPLAPDTGSAGAVQTSPGVIEIPTNDLVDVGPGWTWTAQMRVDGVATPSCGGDVPF
jgi:Mce-associated membrane protein